MKPEMLLVQGMMPPIEQALDAAYTVHRLFQAADREAFVAEVGGGVRGIVTGGGTGASAALMAALPKLEIVAVNGIGTDAVDLDYARGRGIRVTTTPDVLTDDVADTAWALILAASRHVCKGDRFVRAGHWTKGGMPLATKVTGKRLGILGLGRIGRAVAKRAAGFDMAISYTDLRPVEGVPHAFVPDLTALAAAVDILVVAASGGPQSRGIVDAAVMDALGPQGLLVNIARGSVVDEPALVAALTEGRLGGAGLDVFAREPHVPEALLALDHVVLLPHVASGTTETRQAMGELVLANLEAQFAGRPLPTAVV
jgi:lactate dehydrogenase-like 2-hydroxyacid dehydrogenase